MKSDYFFFFGGFPRLSLAELKALLPSKSHQVNLIQPHLARVSNLTSDQFEWLKSRLGGSLKIAQSLAQLKPDDSFQANLFKLLSGFSTKNLALTDYASLDLPSNFISQLKSQFKRPVRFLSFSTAPHSLVALRKQHVSELNLIAIPNSTELIAAKTVWIQNSDQWVKLDRYRPYQDIKRGMLPPKVARVMINLATTINPQGFLADPFCGTGTIALEAVRLGYQVLASDLDSKAVVGTKKNLDWLVKTFSLKPSFQTQQLNAVHLSQAASGLDFIVTEPFMGILLDRYSNLTPQKLKNNIKGLNKLYTGALKDWRSILSPEGRVVIIFPEFHLFNRVWSLPLIDTCENLGYNKLAQLSYSKPQATVVRQILVLSKTNN